MEFEKGLSEQIKAHPEAKAQYLRLMPVLESVAARREAEAPYVIAVDGRAASGKSTMGQQLAEILGAGLVHMDDFFLPLELRTEQRLRTPGGNVHYERFREEVLPHLRQPEPFSYRKFVCSVKALQGERQECFIIFQCFWLCSCVVIPGDLPVPGCDMR